MVSRRRRRRYYSNGDYVNKQSGILLAEFKFYNKEKKVISNKVLKEMEDRLFKDEGTEKKIYWTNKTFAKYHIGFQFELSKEQLKDGKIEKDIYIEIMEFSHITIDAETFNNCKDIICNMFFFGFILGSKQKQFVENLYNGNEKEKIISKLIMSWDEYKQFAITNKLLNKISLSNWEENYGDRGFKEWLDAFGFDAKQPSYSVDVINSSSYRDADVGHIFKVFEERFDDINYRIALIRDIDGDNSGYYTFEIYPETHPEYNQIDEDRIFLKEDGKYYYLDLSLTEWIETTTKSSDDEPVTTRKVRIRQEVFNAMSRNIGQIISKEPRIITPSIYRFYAETAVRFDNREDTPTDMRQLAINERYKKLIEEGKTIKIGNITMNKNEIAIIGQPFHLKFSTAFLNVIDKFHSIKKALDVRSAEFNFNTIYEKILQMSSLSVLKMLNTRGHDYKNFKHTQFEINGMTINVTKETTRININGVFCRIDDVYYILSKLICYNDVNEFNKYVKDVSFIGAEWKKMICNGISLDLSNPFYAIFKQTGDTSFESMHMRFSLLWSTEKRTRIYLMLNNQKYLIKQKQKFKKYYNMPRRTLTITQMKIELKECLENLNDNDILEIVENAIQEAKIVKERGEELVRNTIKEIGAKYEVLEIRGKKIEGYRLIGRRTKADYFIHKTDLTVYKFRNGSWDQRCVTNDHSKQRIFEDKLANRLVNIYNEPKKIYTIIEK